MFIHSLRIPPHPSPLPPWGEGASLRIINEKSSTILIVEDNPGDIRLIKEAFKTSSIDPTLYFARDGVEATHFLETRKREPSHGFPQLIVLDLNLPKKSGFEVLQFVKRDETC